MPKITRVISETRPGAVQLPSNVPFATAEDLGAGAFRELTRFGGTLAKVAQQMQDQADDLELAEAKGKFDAGVKDAALEAEKAPDFFERPALFARDTRQLATDLTETIKSNAVKRAFTAFVVRRLPAQIIDVKADALRALNADNAVRLEEHLEFLKRKIAEQTSLEAQEELIAFGVDLVIRAQARNTLTPEGGRVLRKGFLADTKEVQIRQVLQLDPFLAAEMLRSEDLDIDPIKRLNLLRTATVRQRELLRLDREAEREADRLFREERRIAVGELFARAGKGELSLDQIEEERQVLGLGAQEVRMLEDEVENEPAGRSDLQIKDDVIRRVNLIPPQITRAELFRLREQQREGGRGLNRKDFQIFIDRLDSNAASAASPARSQLLFEHRQGEDQIRLSMRSQHPSDVWEAASAQTLAVAMDEFRKRSAALVPGGERPMVASRSVIRQFLPMLSESARAAINARRNSQPFQTKQALVNARATKIITDDQYYALMKVLREIETAEIVLQAVTEEIARAQKAGQLSEEPRPTVPAPGKDPPPPGLGPPQSLVAPPITPSPVIPVEPGLRVTGPGGR